MHTKILVSVSRREPPNLAEQWWWRIVMCFRGGGAAVAALQLPGETGRSQEGRLPSSSYSSIMASWARASVQTRVIVIPGEYDVIS